jgi:transcriptional regulatory C-terminal domain protein
MRVLYIGLNEQEAHKDIELIRASITNKYNDCIIFDSFGNTSDEIDEALYCMEIRRYDLIFVYFDNAMKNKYCSLLGVIDKLYEHKVVSYFISDEAENDISFQFFKNQVSQNYERLDINFINEGMNDKELASFIAKTCEFFFMHELRFRNITLNALDKSITVHSDSGSLTMYLEKPHNFLVLSYFLRHYGQTVSFSELMSAITEEPEEASESLVENAIYFIRQMFKRFQVDPITSLRKNGYKFNHEGLFQC